MTASLLDLGLDSALVGVTDYCQVSGSAAVGMRRVGGPKDARLVDILDLSPDLVIANPEENARPLVEQLDGAGIPVWLTFPKTVRESVDDLWTLAKMFQGKTATPRLKILEDSLQLANLAMSDFFQRSAANFTVQGISPDAAQTAALKNLSALALREARTQAFSDAFYLIMMGFLLAALLVPLMKKPPAH